MTGDRTLGVDDESSTTPGVVRSGRPVGASVGRYVVLERVGAGAMGEVVRAYDPKLHREVALKRVHPTALGASGETRLVREARAMAQLSHPNVVGVYDVEVEEGGVTMVMEYVPSITLTDWLREHRDWRAILAAFRQAGQGLAAAHGVDLVHRDFKPSNVLIAADDRVKVTDFGLAKGAAEVGEEATGELPGLDATLTQAGTVMGTPRYMAPEQHRGATVDARADQYAFCVALWEALDGAPPFAGELEALAKCKHRGPPAWPRGSPVPRRLVDAIIRGLAPVPARRWPSMDALLEALTHDPSRARRRRAGLVGLVVLVGIAGLGTWAWDDERAEPCTGARQQLEAVWDPARRADVEQAIVGTNLPYARAAWARMGESLDAYAGDWVQQHTEACEATTLRGDQSGEVMDLRMSCLARARTALEVAVDLLARADEQVVEHGQDVVMGLPSLTRCADVEALLSRVPPPEDPAIARKVDEVRERLARAKARHRAAKYEEALEELRSLHAEAAALGYPPLQAEVSLLRATVLHRVASYEEALDEAEAALALALEHDDLETATTAASLVTFLLGVRSSRFEPAERIGTIALALAKRLGDPAVEGGIHNARASVLGAQGRLDEAEQEYRLSLELRQAVEQPKALDLAASHNNLGTIHARQGEYEQAETELRAALRLWESAHGPEHPDVALAHNNLGLVLGDMGEPEQAAGELRLALRLWEATLSPDHPHLAIPHANLGRLFDEQGQHRAAEAEYRIALRIRERALGHQDPNVAGLREDLASCLQAQGRLDEARAELSAALSIIEQALPADHSRLAELHGSLGQLLETLGEHELARPHLERYWAQAGGQEPTVSTGQLAFSLAKVLWALGEERARAIELATVARQAFEGSKEHHEDRRLVVQWLAEHPTTEP